MRRLVAAVRGLLRKAAAEAPPPPLTASERARLAHRRRALQRELRALEKGHAGGCATCVGSEPSRGAIRAARYVDHVRGELRDLDRRLGPESA